MAMNYFLNKVVVVAMLAVPSCWCVVGQSQGGCHISGRVYTSSDIPLSGAVVSIFPLQVAWSGTMPAATTDENGYYSLDLPAIGKTRIFAAQKALGYPNTFYSLFSSGIENDPVENLTPGANLSDVDIHLGPPDGIIEVIIVNKSTGMKITDAHITLRRKDDRKTYFSTSVHDGFYTTPLPERPIIIEITAPGFQTWHYASISSGADFVMMKTNEHKLIRAELFPLPYANKR